MALTQEQAHGLNIALEESRLLGVEVDPTQLLCAITVSVLALPEQGPADRDPRLQILLNPVGRVCASLREGRWDDLQAPVQKFDLCDLLQVVKDFGGSRMYGWEFIDSDADGFERWSDRLSMDWSGDSLAMNHSLALFQTGATTNRILELKIWFRDIQFLKPSGERVGLDCVIAAGKRWWDGLYAGDERTNGYGIFPGKPSIPNSPSAQ